jgi:hypothetical protein
MPDETDAASESSKPEAAKEPKVRRISNKNPGKSTKPSPDTESKSEKKAEENQGAGAAPDSKEDARTDQKRKNRRRRGKAKPPTKDSELGAENDSPDGEATEPTSEASPETPPARDKSDPPGRPKENQRQQQKSRPKLDADKVAKNAWKIFLAEVSEEGVALIGDNDARELARRCFRLAEIFLEEQDRRD